MFRREADFPEAWLERGVDADNEPLDFQIVHYDLESVAPKKWRQES
jgi:hypothetical protein